MVDGSLIFCSYSDKILSSPPPAMDFFTSTVRKRRRRRLLLLTIGFLLIEFAVAQRVNSDDESAEMNQQCGKFKWVVLVKKF